MRERPGDRSFCWRALNKIPGRRRSWRRAVAASAGNHGRRGHVRLVALRDIVVPTTCPRRSLFAAWAEVAEVPGGYGAAEVPAADGGERGAYGLGHNDPDVIAGQGRLA
jgi:hypothetical protein